MSIELLEIYSEYLLSSFGQPSVTGVSGLLTGNLSYNQKNSAREMAQTYAVLSFGKKPYTGKNEFICRHFDPANNSPGKGINLLNCLYLVKGVLLPANHVLLMYTAFRLECLAMQLGLMTLPCGLNDL